MARAARQRTPAEPSLRLDRHKTRRLNLMTDLIDGSGPILGIAAFLGLAILAFLIVQQAREVRRLREWAGRAPERATEAPRPRSPPPRPRRGARGEPRRSEAAGAPPARSASRVRRSPRLGRRRVRRARPPAAGRPALPARRCSPRRVIAAGGAHQRLRPHRRRRRRRRQRRRRQGRRRQAEGGEGRGRGPQRDPGARRRRRGDRGRPGLADVVAKRS